MKSGNQSGISLEPSVRYQTGREHHAVLSVIECGILLLYFAGFLLTLHLTVGFFITPATAVSAFLFAALFTALYHLGRYKIYALLSASVLFVFYLILFWNTLREGMSYFQFQLITAINHFYGTNFYVGGGYYSGTDPRILSAVLIITVLYLLSLLIGYTIVSGRSYLVLAVAAAPFWWMAVNLGESPHNLPTLLLLLSILAAYALHRGWGYVRYRGFDGDFAPPIRRNGGMLRRLCQIGCKKESMMKGTISVTAIAAAILLVVMATFPEGEYVWKDRVWEFLDNPPTLFNFSGNASSSDIGHTGIGGGRMGQVGEVRYRHQTMLEVVSTSFEAPMFLKGYVGSVYRHDHWDDLDASIYADPLFGELADGDIQPQFISEDFYAYLSQELQGAAVQKNEITLQAEGEDSRFLFLPYNLLQDETFQSIPNQNFVRDTIVTGNGFSGGLPYSVQAYFFPEWLRVVELDGGDGPEFRLDDKSGNYTQEFSRSHQALFAMAEPYLKSEAGAPRLDRMEQYAAFAQKNYTLLPETGLERFRSEYNPQRFAGMNAAEIVEEVKTELHGLAAYSLSPGRTPEGEDFVEYFLYEQHEGYCVHFAAAATLMFRAAGIPARYVEGYVVRSSDYENKSDNGRVLIPDANAHAWPEIYLAPFGWIPVEVTPGFLGGGEIPGLTESDPLSSLEESVSSPAEVSSALESEALPPSAEQPQTSSEPITPDMSASGSNGGSELSQKEGSMSSRALLLLLTGVSLLLLALLLTYLRRFWASTRRKKSFWQESNNRSAIAVYRYLMALLQFIGISPADGQTPQEFAKAAESADSRLSPGEFQRATELALKARFSNDEITSGQLREIRSLAKRLDRQIYDGLGFWKRIQYKYGANLR